MLLHFGAVDRCTKVLVGGMLANIARNARLHDSVTSLAGDAEQARKRFDEGLSTTPARGPA